MEQWWISDCRWGEMLKQTESHLFNTSSSFKSMMANHRIIGRWPLQQEKPTDPLFSLAFPERSSTSRHYNSNAPFIKLKWGQPS